jgi:hypothetical protein
MKWQKSQAQEKEIIGGRPNLFFIPFCPLKISAIRAVFLTLDL